MCCGAGGGGLIHRLGLFLWVRNFKFYYFWGFWEKVAIFFFFAGSGGGAVRYWPFAGIFWGVTFRIDYFWGQSKVSVFYLFFYFVCVCGGGGEGGRGLL